MLLQLPLDPCSAGVIAEEAFPAGPVDTSPASFWKLTNHMLEVCRHIFLFHEHRRRQVELRSVYGLNKDKAMKIQS